jgi:hypothetical protein
MNNHLEVFCCLIPSFIGLQYLDINVKWMVVMEQKQRARFKWLIVKTIMTVICLLAVLVSVIYSAIVSLNVRDNGQLYGQP